MRDVKNMCFCETNRIGFDMKSGGNTLKENWMRISRGKISIRFVFTGKGIIAPATFIRCETRSDSSRSCGNTGRGDDNQVTDYAIVIYFLINCQGEEAYENHPNFYCGHDFGSGGELERSGADADHAA